MSGAPGGTRTPDLLVRSLRDTQDGNCCGSDLESTVPRNLPLVLGEWEYLSSPPAELRALFPINSAPDPTILDAYWTRTGRYWTLYLLTLV